MSARGEMSAAHFVPGGIRSSDHWHRRLNDDTCSRCRKPVPDHDVPFLLWTESGEDMLIYCEACLEPAVSSEPEREV